MRSDRLSALFWLGGSIFVCVKSYESEVGTIQVPGPGFLPFCAGVVLGVLALVLLIVPRLGGATKDTISALWNGFKWPRVVLVLCLLFAYSYLLPLIGYLLATFAVLTGLFSVMRTSRFWLPVGAALVTSVLSYVIFATLLGVQLPKGPFGL
jgi:hypothetical protein